MDHHRYRVIPEVVLHWCYELDAWMVGSGAAWFVGESDAVPNDLDVIIPPDRFMAACRRIPSVEQVNHFGGLKTKLEGFAVDFWPSTLEQFIKNNDRPGAACAVRLFPRRIVRWENP